MAPPLVLEFGCGSTKRYPGSIGVDRLPSPAVDVVADASDYLRELACDSVDHIFSSHFIEHLPDPVHFIEECARVLKSGGIFETIAPHWSNPWFHSDPTHARTWGLYSMCYFADNDYFQREVPCYSERWFNVEHVGLGFRSSFAGRNIIKRALGVFVNSSRYTQEFYEEMLSSVFSCYEVHYVLRRK